MLQVLRWAAKPWEGPVWLLLIFLAVNRWILSASFGTGSWNLTLESAVPQFISSMIKVLAISLGIAASMALMLRLMGNEDERAGLADLFELSLKAQSPYLLAAPLALAVLGLSAYLEAEQILPLVKSSGRLMSFAMFCVLFAMMRKRFKALGDLKILSVILSPYLFLFLAFALGAAVLITGLAVLIAQLTA